MEYFRDDAALAFQFETTQGDSYHYATDIAVNQVARYERKAGRRDH